MFWKFKTVHRWQPRHQQSESLTGFGRRAGNRTSTLPTESGGLQDDPLDNAGADAERPGNLEDVVTFGPQFPYRRLDRRLDPSPAELRTVLTCPRQPGVNALPNYTSFKFRKHT